MKSSGARNQSGITAQNWAALSLFTQYSAYRDFIQIDLEKPKLADFALVFTSKRVICESKKSHITYANVRNILDTIPAVKPSDEILIICTSTSPRLKEDLEHVKYFDPVKEKLITKHKFTARHIKLIPQLKIWEVDQSLNRDIVKNLLGERFQSWLPDDELNDLVKSLLVTNIYEKSSKGGSYTKTEFDNELKVRREKLKEKDDYKASERSARQLIAKFLKEIKDPDSRLQSENRLKAIVADSKLHYFAIKEITKANDLDLSLWHNFWHATFSSYYSREVLRIFEDNIKSKRNAKYAVSFIKENLHRLRFKNLEEYEYKASADILIKAVNISSDLAEDVVLLLKKLYGHATDNPLFVEGNSRSRDKWLMEELAKDFGVVFTKGDENLKTQIVEFIFSTFNIVDEDSEYWHDTPFEFYRILKDDLISHPNKFNKFLERIKLQYQEFYKTYHAKYEGWELMGGSVSNFGGDYKVHDRTFIETIIQPYLNKLSDEEMWKVCDQYLATTEAEVSSDKPDFMNRALLPFLVDQYAGGSDKAFEILSKFTRMRKGIPHKPEVIFNLVRDKNMTPQQKWNLLDVAIQEFGFPINIFMDQVLWELLDKEYEPAVKAFSSLLENENYMKRQVMFDTTVTQSLTRLISNVSTFDQGTKLLDKFLHGSYFKKLDSFHSYDAKAPLLDVLNKDFDKGLKILKKLVANKPNENQQRVFGTVLRDTPDDLLNDVYSKLVLREINRFKDASEMSKTYTNIETRENFIWFAEKLAKKHQFEEAMPIAEFFLNDPDPLPNSKYDDEVKNGKNNFTINTVRGCVAWVLLPVNSIAGRIYTEKAFEITKKLCNDKSLYVRQMSLLLLEALANNRHTTMPGSKEWFMKYRTAKAIEDFAFAMLKDKTNYHNAIMLHLARVFCRIRTLSDQQAIEVIKTFDTHGDRDTLKELDSFIIFMAEFRKDAFKDWPKSRGTIPAYNPKPVQDLLAEFLEKGSDEHRESLVWHIVKLPEDGLKDDKRFNKFFAISTRYLPHIFKKYSHHVFHHLHRFIEKYIDRKFSECYKLWRASLDVERPAVIAEAKKDQHPGEYSWWPYHYNGSILSKVFNNLGIDQFLNDFEFLADYPEQVDIAYDIDKALAKLETITTNKDQIKKLYEKLISRNYNFNSSYENWLANNEE